MTEEKPTQDEIRAKIVAIDSALVKIESEYDAGRIDLGRYTQLKIEYEAQRITLEGQLPAATTLAENVAAWYKILGYEQGACEQETRWVDFVFDRKVNVPGWGDLKQQLLVRCQNNKIGIAEVNGLQDAVAVRGMNKGRLITNRRVTPQARKRTEESENIAALTFDELIDESADFSPYFAWLEKQVKDKQIDAQYVDLACSQVEFDPHTQEQLAVNRYGAAEGWIDGTYQYKCICACKPRSF